MDVGEYYNYFLDCLRILIVKGYYGNNKNNIDINLEV